MGKVATALRAKGYCCYPFPHFNIGRIYLKKEMYEKARQKSEKSLELDPNYPAALEGLEILKASGFKDTWSA